MRYEQIVVRVDPEGQIHAETVGMRGQKCLDAIAVLEDLLEAQATSSAFTQEYYEATETSTHEVNNELRQQ